MVVHAANPSRGSWRISRGQPGIKNEFKIVRTTQRNLASISFMFHFVILKGISSHVVWWNWYFPHCARPNIEHFYIWNYLHIIKMYLGRSS